MDVNNPENSLMSPHHEGKLAPWLPKQPQITMLPPLYFTGTILSCGNAVPFFTST